ncbi:MAG: PaREP1 family protein [Thermofilum sp.]|nr:PaREP1 family protein [Thermofilum sp.]
MDGAVTAFLKSLYEFPGLVALVWKLVEEKPLDETDEANLRELAGATGWSVDDVVDDLRNGWGDPLGRVDRYREMFERYFSEALELVDRDARRATGKLWGAVTALVKLHASLKRVFVAGWDHGKLYNYVTSNVEEKYRELFYDLLETGGVLHRHFYEGDLDRDTFTYFWNKAVKLLEEVKEVVYRLYTKAV